MELEQIAGITLRRAVLSTLLAERRPMTAKEVVEVLHAREVTTGSWLTKGPSRVIADLLAHQARIGKVVKTAAATFAVVPESMSRATRYRCLHWDRR